MTNGQTDDSYEFGRNNDIKDTPEIDQDVSTVTSWHDKIASLPQMDPNWAYQIEFGINPPRLYQVRPFKPYEKADFTVASTYKYAKPFVIGITPQDGIRLRAETDLEKRRRRYEPINTDNQPTVVFDKLRELRISEVPNVRAHILRSSNGVLVHEDIRAIRQAAVTALFAGYPEGEFQQGDWVRIRSDGMRINVQPDTIKK